MIKTVIFDIGRVLVDYDWCTYLNKTFTDKETIKVVGKVFFDNPLFVEFDRGVRETEEILSECIKTAPKYKKEIRKAFDEIGQCISLRPFAIPWIKELKNKGFQVLFLSNYSRHVMNSNPQALRFIPYMDGGIFSCDVHLVKPDRAIYEKLIDKYSLKADECIFIDDNAANIEGAKRAGLHAIQYLSYNQVCYELEKQLAV